MPRNTLMDLNNHLFAELERLGDEDLSQEELEKEIARAKQVEADTQTHLGRSTRAYSKGLHCNVLG